MHYADVLQGVADHAAGLLVRFLPGHPVLIIINRTAGTGVRHHQIQATVRSLDPPDLTPTEEAHLECCVTTVWTDAAAVLPDTMGRWLARVRRMFKTDPVVVSLGGDGTHNAVMQAGRNLSGNVIYCRLPLGSGNDAVPVVSLEEALTALQGPQVPQWIPAVTVRTAGGAEYRAFNIASVGIDAYVTMLHHRFRSRLPGNTYRIIANPALLFYETLVGLTEMTVTVGAEGLPPRRVMLLALGVTGNRTYGDHIRILPDSRNLCMVHQAGLLQKFAMKKKLLRGEHVNETHTVMGQTERVELHYPGKLPLQVDGEALWLHREDFPVTMELEHQSVQTLQPPGPGGE